MKNVAKWMVLPAALLFGLAQAKADVITDLVAQANGLPDKKIGEVTVSNDATNLFVKYQITALDMSDQWCLNHTSLAVSTTRGGIPSQGGMPQPVLFPYQTDHECLSQYTYTIPLPAPSGSRLFIAAAANVERLGGYEGLQQILPEEGVMTVGKPSAPTSLFQVTLSEDTFLNGTYPAWCVDPRHGIMTGQVVRVKIYSSLTTLPQGVIDAPENIPMLNWLLNQNFVGTASPGGFGDYTFGDVQRTIWTLLQTNVVDTGLGPWSQDRVNELLSLAIRSGLSFTPNCSEKFGIFFMPVDPVNAQVAQMLTVPVTLADLSFPCQSLDALAWSQSLEEKCEGGKKGAPICSVVRRKVGSYIVQ